MAQKKKNKTQKEKFGTALEAKLKELLFFDSKVGPGEHTIEGTFKFVEEMFENDQRSKSLERRNLAKKHIKKGYSKNSQRKLSSATISLVKLKNIKNEFEYPHLNIVEHSELEYEAPVPNEVTSQVDAFIRLSSVQKRDVLACFVGEPGRELAKQYTIQVQDRKFIQAANRLPLPSWVRFSGDKDLHLRFHDWHLYFSSKSGVRSLLNFLKNHVCPVKAYVKYQWEKTPDIFSVPANQEEFYEDDYAGEREYMITGNRSIYLPDGPDDNRGNFREHYSSACRRKTFSKNM